MLLLFFSHNWCWAIIAFNLSFFTYVWMKFFFIFRMYIFASLLLTLNQDFCADLKMFFTASVAILGDQFTTVEWTQACVVNAFITVDQEILVGHFFFLFYTSILLADNHSLINKICYHQNYRFCVKFFTTLTSDGSSIVRQIRIYLMIFKTYFAY